MSEQSMKALAHANKVRMRQAELKRIVGGEPNRRASLARLIQILQSEEEAVARMSAEVALRACWGMGRAGAARLLSRAAIHSSRGRRPIGKLTAGERRRLVDAVRAELERHQKPSRMGVKLDGRHPSPLGTRQPQASSQRA